MHRTFGGHQLIGSPPLSRRGRRRDSLPPPAPCLWIKDSPIVVCHVCLLWIISLYTYTLRCPVIAYLMSRPSMLLLNLIVLALSQPSNVLGLFIHTFLMDIQ